jgi:hypothetical protein
MYHLLQGLVANVGNINVFVGSRRKVTTEAQAEDIMNRLLPHADVPDDISTEADLILTGLYAAPALGGKARSAKSMDAAAVDDYRAKYQVSA